MRRRLPWSRIFVACAVLTVLAGVGSMFFIGWVGYVGFGHGSLLVDTSRSYALPEAIRVPPSLPWSDRLSFALLPHLFWRYVSGWPSVSSWPISGTIPLWVPAVAFAALAWFTRSRAKPPGCCGKCGYNLTGNVSGVCPECGAKVAKDEP